MTIARIARPRGLQGEVIADLLTDFPQRLTQLKRVFLSPPSGSGPEREMQIHRCWLHQGRAVFHFEGVGTVEAAEKLRGCDVQIPFDERVVLPTGKYFVSDLVGCEVFEVKGVKEVKENTCPAERVSSTSLISSKAIASRIGVVRDLTLESGAPLLIVDSPRGELLIPFAEDICRRIDVGARQIEIAALEGLLDLNASSEKKRRGRPDEAR